MGLSNIQWCDYTFNPWLGCRKVAPECAHCYITSTPPFRFRKLTHGAQRVRTAESTWQQPMAWNRKAEKEGARYKVFCMSLGDWLDDENVPIKWLADLLVLIHSTPQLDWLLLTKRPENWRRRMEAVAAICGDALNGPDPFSAAASWLAGDVPPNIWIGVSAGADQAAALAIPARVHFLSCEPMLHPLDTTHADKFDWIIFGGESGKEARSTDVQWIREGVQFCRANGIASFVKQLGARPVMDDPYLQIIREGKRSPLPLELKDSHGGDMAEWPEDLRVREFPTH